MRRVVVLCLAACLVAGLVTLARADNLPADPSPLTSQVPTDPGQNCAAAVNQAMVSAFAGALRIGQTSPPNDAATVSGTCRTYLGESTAYVDVTIPSRGTRRISARDGGLASLWLSYLSSPVGGPQRQVFLVPNVWTEVTVPDTGSDIDWQLRIALPPAGQIAICG